MNVRRTRLSLRKQVGSQQDSEVKVSVAQQPQPRLPHERDESADSQTSPPQPVIEQAARDLARGLVDTDRSAEADVAYQKQKQK